MRVSRKVLAMLAVGALMVSMAPIAASADYCSQYPSDPGLPTQRPPVVAIGSGYYGVGGPGPLDSFGCVQGSAAADTRVIMPAADFVVVVLARATCNSGQAITSLTVTGLGLNASSQRMSCTIDAKDQLGLPNNRAYVSGIFPISGTVGTVRASVTVGGVTYSGQTSSVVERP